MPIDTYALSSRSSLYSNIKHRKISKSPGVSDACSMLAQRTATHKNSFGSTHFAQVSKIRLLLFGTSSALASTLCSVGLGLRGLRHAATYAPRLLHHTFNPL